jgi:hypothetical protein
MSIDFTALAQRLNALDQAFIRTPARDLVFANNPISAQLRLVPDALENCSIIAICLI